MKSEVNLVTIYSSFYKSNRFVFVNKDLKLYNSNKNFGYFFNPYFFLILSIYYLTNGISSNLKDINSFGYFFCKIFEIACS